MAARHGGDGPLTLRMKFKAGAVTKYKVTMLMDMAVPGEHAKSAVMHALTGMTMTQKVDRALPNGGGVVTITYGKPVITMNGQPVHAPTTISNLQPTTLEYDARGKVKTMNRAGAAAGPGPMNSMLGSANGVSMPGMIPGHPVKVGDTWWSSLPVPMLGGNLAYKYTLVGMGNVNGRRVAHIRMALRMPLTKPVGPGQSGAGTPPGGISGVLTGAGDVDFAVDEGILVRTTMRTNITPHTSGGAKPAGAIPPSVNMHMELEVKLVP
jgi:hypothetical protein